jgi:hypothetical protein
MDKETIRILMWNAWKAAANAHRLYPENKHTFTDYYDTIGEKDLDQAIASSPLEWTDEIVANMISSYSGDMKIPIETARSIITIMRLDGTLNPK